MRVSRTVTLPDDEIELMAIRASGPGGQNVNKVSSAIQLFFNIKTSSLPESCKERLLAQQDSRITAEGVLIIKAQSHRSQEKNKEDALKRLRNLIRPTLQTPKKRRTTQPSKASKQKRLDSKKRHSRNKGLRGKVSGE